MDHAPAFTRASIAAMVGPDFETVRRRINPNITHAEQEAALQNDLLQLVAPRCEGMTTDEARRFFEIYFEEQQAMIDRRTRELDFRDSLQRTAVMTAVRASVWDIFFRLLR